MKSKKIPADIKFKSIKEAQNEINEIITNLEDNDVNLEESMDKYNRMMYLNEHIREQFKKQLKEIRNFNFKDKKDLSAKD
jgi:exodeoxyribonuclease VII small subunit